jgi:hypothetical protein
MLKVLLYISKLLDILGGASIFIILAGAAIRD